MSEREYEALRSALASTRMEGFNITEQTEQDCIRLMKSEISVSDLIKEILIRIIQKSTLPHDNCCEGVCFYDYSFFSNFG